MADRSFQVARFHFNHPAGSEWLNNRADHIWEDCQFRFYDDNDDENSPDNPEVPHVFSTRDYVLGGILIFEFRKGPYVFIPGPKFDRAAAIAEMKTIKDRIFWGPTTASDDALNEIPVTIGPYHDGLLPLGPAVGNQRYIIFPPRSLAPGKYKWRWEQVDPLFGVGVYHGAVTITP
jgi:hypothetical protein